MVRVALIDYGAGNVRSLKNALISLGLDVDEILSPEEISTAHVLLFPGVGSFGNCMEVLKAKGFVEPLRAYVRADRPFLGICLGMQTLFEGSDESPGAEGLGLLPGRVGRFNIDKSLAVPQIGWNGISPQQESPLFNGLQSGDALYFVHSFRVPPSAELTPWTLCLSRYGETYVSGVSRGRVSAVQFHPEKSGAIGLRMLKAFISDALGSPPPPQAPSMTGTFSTEYCKRVVACLDVRANDQGDLVVTKGDQYDVRERGGGKGSVRNLGKPVALARRYYEEGADEITFLNITGFRECPLSDLPMLQVLREASSCIFVPLTVGGGIKDMVDQRGVKYSALQVADAYFRAGADKISIGSDAVDAARHWIETGKTTGSTSIEQISFVYGKQAVVVSLDPRRVWVADEAAADGHALADQRGHEARGPNGETLCWYECTVHGGRKGSGLDVVQVSRAVERLGCGELLVNCIDKDGQNNGFELPLLQMLRETVGIPVIASSGAGNATHFSELFAACSVEAALAASIFHRHQVTITEVKRHLAEHDVPVRRAAAAVIATSGQSRLLGVSPARAFTLAALAAAALVVAVRCRAQ
eukprot:CAMPEP_0183351214 /NCGR_PEP_ID=MMETSP0164_2-20130417/23425_1 /TAXON_ID=221442 /ORGANISM="Coccolithus pelagicus ssp braarudi, Strain PLY182g" /LENGTH=585 /DNA_ID=CAMNT_0025523331 /DNA_START=24 /DNA_END=1781 /DNA_ORIENTATION=+